MKPTDKKVVSESLDFSDHDAFMRMASVQDENLKALEMQSRVHLRIRGNKVTVQGTPEQVNVAVHVLNGLYRVALAGTHIEPEQVKQTVVQASKQPGFSVEKAFLEGMVVNDKYTVIPKTPGQRRYLQAIRTHDIVFATGPAGTGKTFLAMAAAIAALMDKKVSRIILSRPAVEAGERLGFLPGDLQEKVDPYLRPLYDALQDHLGMGKAAELMNSEQVEVAPLAFMRGRTLNNAFVILDEAQNTSIEQMKMFLTRLGYNSRAVITGDVTQIDLPIKNRSGLVHAASILQGIDGIAVCRLTRADVVRHPLVQKIIEAYESDEGKRGDTEPA